MSRSPGIAPTTRMTTAMPPPGSARRKPAMTSPASGSDRQSRAFALLADPVPALDLEPGVDLAAGHPGKRDPVPDRGRRRPDHRRGDRRREDRGGVAPADLEGAHHLAAARRVRPGLCRAPARPDQRSVPPTRRPVRAPGDAGPPLARRHPGDGEGARPEEPGRHRADHAGITRGDVRPARRGGPTAVRRYPGHRRGRAPRPARHRARDAPAIPAGPDRDRGRSSHSPGRAVGHAR